MTKQTKFFIFRGKKYTLWKTEIEKVCHFSLYRVNNLANMLLFSTNKIPKAVETMHIKKKFIPIRVKN